MRFLRLQNATLALSLLAVVGLMLNTTAPVAYAQTAVTGGLSGTVSDGTGAVVPGATVVVVDTGTDSKQTVKSNAEGRYTVSSLKPGLYKVTASAESLKSDTVEVTVIIGTTVPADIKVTPTGSNTVVEVTSTSLPLVDTQNVALATTFNEEQIQDLPTPGGDVTTVAFTAPGVVVNAGGAYGNFSSDGLPGISNLFVLNGFDNQDPFLNLNNSGSSNLTLGQGELAEATVVQNGYNSQYGRAAGAVINYTTKSGGNKFHGMADYNYNGTVLNSNGWFNGFYGLSRPHAVSNEWALNAGGPIIKDKLFFFSDYEGLHYVLPGAAGLVNYPSAAFQSWTLANVNASYGSTVQQSYAQTFNAYKTGPTYASSTPLTTGDGTINGGCGDFAGTPAPGGGYFGAYPGAGATGTLVPCMTQAAESVNNINIEWLFTQRVDWNISDKHKIYARYKMDRGSQPTGTSFINPLFSTVSIQPEYEGQFNDSYVISPTKTNVLVAAANWYSAYFGPVNTSASQAELPVDFYYSDYGLDGSGVNAAPGLPALGVPFYLTQGRNVAQYQIEDDFSWIHGKHTFKLGENFRRDLVSDYDAQVNVKFPYIVDLSLGDFVSGQLSTTSPFAGSNSYNQAFAVAPTAHLALYNVGAYFQDEWQALPNLKLTLGARVDRTGNPLCHDDCFSTYQGAFPSTATAYNATVNAAQSHPFQQERFEFQPRVGFNYSFNDRTELRGGIGLFSDLYPAVFVDSVIQNFPNYNAESVYTGAIAVTGAGTAGSYASAANQAVQSGFTSGQGIADINNSLYAQGVPFSPPAINAYFGDTFKVPEYLEFSLQLQHQLTKNDAVTVTYAGNYGYREILQNQLINAASGNFANDPTGGSWQQVAPFAGLPVTPPDPRFSRITEYTNDGHSNYSGGMVSYKHNGHGFTGQLSYTYSHSLDMVSGGQTSEPFNSGSVNVQLTPSVAGGGLNYSNSDYDIRNNLVGDAVYEEPFKSSNKLVDGVAGGWVVGLKTYYRGGEPYTLFNGATPSAFHNLGTSLMPDLASGVTRSSITNPTGSNPHSCVDASCLDVTQFGDYSSQADFGNLRRNSIYGPHYVNTDISLLKKLVKTEGLTLQIGANAYNIFNHVNFAPPSGDISSGAFGLITGAEAPPTSPYGSFQGAAVTQRLLQVHGKITF